MNINEYAWLTEFLAAPRRIVTEHEAAEANLTLPFIPVESYGLVKPEPYEVGCMAASVHIAYTLDGLEDLDRCGTLERLFLARPVTDQAQL